MNFHRYYAEYLRAVTKVNNIYFGNSKCKVSTLFEYRLFTLQITIPFHLTNMEECSEIVFIVDQRQIVWLSVIR